MRRISPLFFAILVLAAYGNTKTYGAEVTKIEQENVLVVPCDDVVERNTEGPVTAVSHQCFLQIDEDTEVVNSDGEGIDVNDIQVGNNVSYTIPSSLEITPDKESREFTVLKVKRHSYQGKE